MNYPRIFYDNYWQRSGYTLEFDYYNFAPIALQHLKGCHINLGIKFNIFVEYHPSFKSWLAYPEGIIFNRDVNEESENHIAELLIDNENLS